MTDSTENTPVEDPAEDVGGAPASEPSSAEVGFIEGVFLMGLGAATATRAAVESLTKELVDRGKVSQQEAQKFAQDLARRADESTKGLQGRAREQSGRAANLAGFATKDDVDKIEKDIAEIKQLLMRGTPVGDDEPYTP